MKKMVTKTIETPIGLHDGKILHYTRTERSLSVEIKTWNEQTLIIVFREILSLRDVVAVGVDLHTICEVFDSEYLASAESSVENGIIGEEDRKRLRHFVILDLDEIPVLEILAEEIVITVR